MDSASVVSAFTLNVSGGAPVAASVFYDEGDRTAILDPSSDLLPGTQYTATIASSVKDINGGAPLSTDFVWSFTTSPAMFLTSKNTDGVTSNNISGKADIDSTGRYIVFESKATNLSSDATTTGGLHVYRKDTITGEALLVSSDSSGLEEADNDASNPSIASNGRYVVFESKASNLDGSTNGISQIFLKDLSDGSIELVSRNAVGTPDNGTTGASNASVSDDGRYILFQSSDAFMSTINGNGNVQVYLKDRSDGSVTMISRQNASIAGNDDSTNPDMSSNGIHIVFESKATNLTASNSFKHIYYVDTSMAHTVEQISVVTGGDEATADSDKPSVSDDGLVIVFHTVGVLSESDINGVTDVYLHYRPFVLTQLISVNPNTSNSGNGASSNGHISGNADYVVFESLASDLVNEGALGFKDIFVRNLSALPSTIINKVNNPESGSEATASSDNPVISADGRYVGFHSIEKFTVDDTDTLSDVFRANNSTYQ